MTILEGFNAIKEVLNNSTVEDKDELLEITQREIDKILSKQEKRKVKQELSKEKTAELTDLVESLLTDKPQTAIDILAQIEHDDDLTRGMISSRLADLVRQGRAIGVTSIVEICGRRQRMRVYHK